MHSRKSLCCQEQTIEGDSGRGPERKEDSVNLLRKYLSDTDQNVGRNVDGKRYSDEL